MTRIRAYKLVAATLLAATSLISVAKADLSPLSRTSDYALDWSDSTFDNADALYVTSYAYGAQTPTTQTFNQSFSSNAAEPFFFDTGGGISISGISGTPGPGAVVEIDLASNGSAGFWDVSYNEPAIPLDGVLTPGTSGGLATLNFTGGGFVNGTNVLMTEYRHSSSYLSTLQVIGRLWELVLATLSSTVLVQGYRLQPSLSTQPMILQRWSRLTMTTRAEASLTWTSLYSELKSLSSRTVNMGYDAAWIRHLRICILL
jgi:hypothetical protein